MLLIKLCTCNILSVANLYIYIFIKMYIYIYIYLMLIEILYIHTDTKKGVNIINRSCKIWQTPTHEFQKSAWIFQKTPNEPPKNPAVLSIILVVL